MRTIKFQLETLSCPSCINKIEGKLGSLSGVLKVAVLFHSSKVKIQFDETKVNPDHLKTMLTQLGYPVLHEKVS